MKKFAAFLLMFSLAMPLVGCKKKTGDKKTAKKTDDKKTDDKKTDAKKTS